MHVVYACWVQCTVHGGSPFIVQCTWSKLRAQQAGSRPRNRQHSSWTGHTGRTGQDRYTWTHREKKSSITTCTYLVEVCSGPWHVLSPWTYSHVPDPQQRHPPILLDQWFSLTVTDFVVSRARLPSPTILKCSLHTVWSNRGSVLIRCDVCLLCDESPHRFRFIFTVTQILH